MDRSNDTAGLMDLGVIILNYNGVSDTLECLATLRHSTYTSARVYVVDNGSRTDEASIIALQFPNARVVRSLANLGFAGGVNLGARLASEDGVRFLLLLNNDTRVPETTIQLLVDAFAENVNLGICGPRILEYGGTHIQNCGYEYNRWTGTARAIRGKEDAKLPGRSFARVAYVMGCALMLPVSVFLASGGLDESFFLYWEDHILSSKVRQLGYDIGVIENATVEHRVTVGREYSRRYIYHMIFGHIHFVRKTSKWYEIPTQAVGVTFRALAYFALNWLRNNDIAPRIIFHAIRDGLTGRVQKTANF